VIEPTRAQLSLAEGLIQEEVGPLWEEWMREVDQVLADRELVQNTQGIVHRLGGRKHFGHIAVQHDDGRSLGKPR
jgi:hypothetical protein